MNNIFNFFKRKYPTGVRIDKRSPEQKALDWKHEEISFGEISGDYGTKEDISFKYPVADQKKTQSCIAHAVALSMGIENETETRDFADLSKSFIYKQRINYPTEGMLLVDAGSIAKNQGSCLYETMPTPDTEFEINNIAIPEKSEEEASEYRQKAFISITDCKNIDTLNSVVSQGKGVILLLYASYKEWAREYPVANDKGVTFENAQIRHGICTIPDSGFIENGKKYIAIQDSAHFGGFTHRYISEDFIKARCYGALYFIDMKNEKVSFKPKHFFKVSLKFGETSEEVKWLQKCLQYDGFFPSNLLCTGYFGAITAKALYNWQVKNNVASKIELDSVQGRIAGPKTLLILNHKFQ